MQEMPYSVLKKDEQSYAILLRRDQEGRSFPEIAAAFGLSASWVSQLYYRIKAQQIHLYIRRVAAVLGHPDTSQVEQAYGEALACYQHVSYACAWLEQRYADILTAYRDGEPGMPPSFVRTMPPFQTGLDKKTASRIVKMRDTANASFAEIARALYITPEKARRLYDGYYHARVLKQMRRLEAKEKVKTSEQRLALWEPLLEHRLSSKRRYEMLDDSADSPV